MGDLAAMAAGDAGVFHMGNRRFLQWIGAWPQGKGRATGKPHARMVAGADLGVYAEFFF